jgi:DNA-binding NtrC family response regulator
MLRVGEASSSLALVRLERDSRRTGARRARAPNSWRTGANGARARPLEQNAPPRILLADAEPAIRDYVGAILGKLGFDVTLVGDPADVVPAFQAVRFDLVVLDFMGGAREGVEIARRLAAVRPDVPVVVCTDPASWDAVVPLLDERHAGFLPKPFDLEEGLYPMLREFFDQGP